MSMLVVGRSLPLVRSKISNLSKCWFYRSFSTESVRETSSSNVNSSTPEHLYYFHEKCDNKLRQYMLDNMLVYPDFLTEGEEQSLYKEVDKYVKRMRYEYDHWDDAIHGYKETEFSRWSDSNKQIIQRVRDVAFPPGVQQLPLVHVIDLADNGYIKPHIDSVKFCGNIITGLSLLSSSIMRLVHDKNKELKIDILLKPRSLYVMRDAARFDYTHEILPDSESYFKGRHVPRARRISIMCRNEVVNQ